MYILSEYYSDLSLNKICFWHYFLLGGDRAGGKGVCGRFMSPAQETQSMRELRLLRGRLQRKGPPFALESPA
jgi:hypothetical protein